MAGLDRPPPGEQGCTQEIVRLALQGAGAAENDVAGVVVAPGQLAAERLVKMVEERARRQRAVLARRRTAQPGQQMVGELAASEIGAFERVAVLRRGGEDSVTLEAELALQEHLPRFLDQPRVIAHAHVPT